MATKDPKRADDEESETEEWVLVPGELEDSVSDLAASFVDLQTADTAENEVSESQGEPQGEPQGESDEKDNMRTEPKQEVQNLPEESHSCSESSSTSEAPKTKTSYAEILRKANQQKPTWTPRGGKTRTRRKKTRPMRSQQSDGVSQAEKKTQRRGSCAQPQGDDSHIRSHPATGHNSEALTLVY